MNKQFLKKLRQKYGLGEFKKKDKKRRKKTMARRRKKSFRGGGSRGLMSGSLVKLAVSAALGAGSSWAIERVKPDTPVWGKALAGAVTGFVTGKVTGAFVGAAAAVAEDQLIEKGTMPASSSNTNAGGTLTGY